MRELDQLGVDPRDAGAHGVFGVRMWFGHRSVDVRWPAADNGPVPGTALRRSTLNAHLLDETRRAGVDVIVGQEAVNPIVERGFVRGAQIADTASTGQPLADRRTKDLRSRFLVVADGASSRFGRGLGTTRDRNWPYAVSASSHFESAADGGAWADVVIGVPDRNGNPVTGHGWVTPLGDGTVNVGVTMLSTYRDVLGVNTVKLFESFTHDVARRWRFDPEAPLDDVVRRRTPLGGSIRPVMGPTFLVAGDAAGMANPFTSHGVGEALLTGRLAAEVLDEALTVGNSTTLQRYPAVLDEALGAYQQVGRLSARFLGRPRLLRTAMRVGIRSEAVMGAAMRVATGELRHDDRGGAERIYRTALRFARFAPSW